MQCAALNSFPRKEIAPPRLAADPDQWLLRKAAALTVLLATLLVPAPLPFLLKLFITLAVAAPAFFLAFGLDTLLARLMVRGQEPVPTTILDQALRDLARTTGATLPQIAFEQDTSSAIVVRFGGAGPRMHAEFDVTVRSLPVAPWDRDNSAHPANVAAAADLRRLLQRAIGRRRTAMVSMALQGRRIVCDIPEPSNHDRLQALAARRV